MIRGGGLCVVMVTTAEGGGATLRVLASMVAARPLAVSEYSRVIHTL